MNLLLFTRGLKKYLKNKNMVTIIIALILGWLLTRILGIEKYLQGLYKHIRRLIAGNIDPLIFERNYLEVKSFYAREFNITPCICFINDLDAAKAYEYVSKGFAGKVLAMYQRSFYRWQHKRRELTSTIFKLENKVMIELGNDYAEILFANNNHDYAHKLMDMLSTYKAIEKEEDLEINIITRTSSGLELKELEIKPTKLDIGLYYNDDFAEIDKMIKQRLSKENDKGIILLHGLPGTGKTTYIRHLIGNLAKRVLFVSPGVAENLMNPEFIDILIDNPNSVLVIEDAENIIMDRKYSRYSSVSNLLNISDGLLSDCLNVQIICTFNNALSMVDAALMRKGRLIAKYEFGKLSTVKAQKLSDHLGLKQTISRAMTLAEITNPEEKEYEADKIEVLGFRRREELMN